MYHLVRKGKGFFSLDLYKGQLQKDKRDGFGIQLFPNGCFYIGFWKNNKAHGMGKLVIKDGTYYEGQFFKNTITEGILSYYNGAKFEGLFDSTPYDRFKNGSFTFANGQRLIADWKDGGLLSGTLYDNSNVIEIKTNDLIIRKKNGYGIVLQKNNKWMYEGGIKKGMCDGDGIIYCTFQQYKSGTFEKDKMNGKCYKVSLNWGEMTEGQRINDKKFGNWSKMLNKGFLIESSELSDEVNISFPFLNDDVFVGTIKYSSDPKSRDFGFLFKQGVYYYRNFGETSETRIDIRNCSNVFDIEKVEERGISFDFTYKKIFKNQDLLKNLRDFLKSAIMKTGVRFEGELKWFLTLTGEAREFQSDVDKKKEQHMKNQIMKQYYKKHRNKSAVKSKNNKIIRKKSAIRNRNNVSMNISSEKHVRKLTTSQYSIASDLEKSYTKQKKRSIIYESKKFRKSKTPIKKKLPSWRKVSSPFEKSYITVKRGLHKKNFQKKNKIDISFGKPQSSRLLKTETETRLPIKPESIISDEEENLKKIIPKKKTKEKRLKKKRSLYKPDFLEHLNFIEIKVEKEIVFFNGNLLNGKKEGFCKILFNTGIYIEAFFVNNKAEGEGFLIMENLFEFRGNFINNFLEGEGTLKINDEIFKGKFNKGFFDNKKILFTKTNCLFIFKNETEKINKKGIVTVYSNNCFKLINCEISKGNVEICKCKMFDNFNNFWIGKIKKFKDQIFLFETSNSPKRFFSIDLLGTGKIELIKSN